MWKILSTEVAGDTLNVDAEFTFADASTKTIRVPCFMPDAKADVLTSLNNRLVSEQRALDAATKNAQIKTEIDADIAKE